MSDEPMTATKLAKLIIQTFDEQGGDAYLKLCAEVAETYGQEMAGEAFEIGDRMKAAEWAEQDAAHEAHERQRAGIMHIFEGLPSMAFEDACRIKAARGDALAQQWLGYFSSREHRLERALTDAALNRHPGWTTPNAEGIYTKLDDNAPDEPELIEWFYKNHPAEARAIEAAIDGGPA